MNRKVCTYCIRNQFSMLACFVMALNIMFIVPPFAICVFVNIALVMVSFFGIRSFWISLLTSSQETSSSSHSHFCMESIFDDIHQHVAWSYTSSAASRFSLISSFTLSNHLLLGIPLLSPVLSFPLPSFLRCAPLFASHAHTHSTFVSYTFFAISPTFVISLIALICRCVIRNCLRSRATYR